MRLRGAAQPQNAGELSFLHLTELRNSQISGR
jgi:hypothetical protein